MAQKLLEALNFRKNKIGTIAIDELCPALLHAAAFEPSLDRIALVNSPVSYRNIVMNKFYEYSQSFSWAVAGALTAYDLTDLAGSIAPRKLLLVGLRDNMKEPASTSLINQGFEFSRSVYSFKNAPENLKVLSSYENFVSTIDWWME